ncbi:MAG: hypothetical protein NTX65_07300 [Ignavibacteriales bacterium]|nr:hypothetical protein [Ignavibacteriales bacterium]
MKPIDNSISILNIFDENLKNVKKANLNSQSKDSVEISNTAKVYDRIDKFLNLGRPDRLDVTDLNDAEKEEFLKMLANLLKHGIIGYEILDVNGKPEKHFIVNQIGDERIYGAKLYKKNGFYKN